MRKNPEKNWKNRLIKKYGYYPYFEPVNDSYTQLTKIDIQCNTHGKTQRSICMLMDKKSQNPCKYCSMVIINNNKCIKDRQDKIDNAVKIHNNKYNYSNIPTILKSNTKVKIICPFHGEFTTRWSEHINKQSGCSTCGHLKPRQYYIDKAEKLHGVGTYSYELLPEIVYSRDKYDFICNKHNFTFSQQLYTHCKNQGCPKCGREIVDNALRDKVSDDEWRKRFINSHGDKYDYSLVGDDIYGCKKITIICPIHGEFNQDVEIHARSSGCRECGKRQCETFMVYSEKSFELKPEMKNWNGRVYVIRLHNGEESFIKIGITKKSIKERCREIRRVGYTVDIIYQEKMKLYDAYNQEQRLLMEVADLQYLPKNKFNGHTECVIDSPLTLNKIENLLS